MNSDPFIIESLNNEFHERFRGDWLTILCAMSLTASLVQVGIASAVIYQMSSLQYFEHESHIGSSKDILDIFNHGLNTFGRSLFDNGMKHVQLRTCYNLIPPGQDTTGKRHTVGYFICIQCISNFLNVNDFIRKNT